MLNTTALTGGNMNTKATLYKVNENSKSGICIPKNEKNEIKLELFERFKSAVEEYEVEMPDLTYYVDNGYIIQYITSKNGNFYIFSDKYETFSVFENDIQTIKETQLHLKCDMINQYHYEIKDEFEFEFITDSELFITNNTSLNEFKLKCGLNCNLQQLKLENDMFIVI